MLLTIFEFVVIVAGVCIFSLGFGFWAGRLQGRADEQWKEFLKRNVT